MGDLPLDRASKDKFSPTQPRRMGSFWHSLGLELEKFLLSMYRPTRDLEIL